MARLDWEGRREIGWRGDPRQRSQYLGKSILISSELRRSIVDFVLLKVGRKTEVGNFLSSLSLAQLLHTVGQRI